MQLQDLLFWTSKTAVDNAWHPRLPGARRIDQDGNPLSPAQNEDSEISKFDLFGTDIFALAVDAAPFIAGAGAVAHLRQWRDFGFTASASVFRNPVTMRAMHVATNVSFVAICVAQVLGFPYRNYIPRWAPPRELRRDEVEARQHVGVGMAIGGGITTLRLASMARKGVSMSVLGRRITLLEMIICGAIADLLHRENRRAHNM